MQVHRPIDQIDKMKNDQIDKKKNDQIGILALNFDA